MLDESHFTEEKVNRVQAVCICSEIPFGNGVAQTIERLVEWQ